MSLKQAATIQASVVWDQEQANAGFEATKQSGSDAHALRPSVTTYQEIFLAAYTVTARRLGLDAVRATMAITAFAFVGFVPLFALAATQGWWPTHIAQASWGELLFQAAFQGGGSVVISGITFTQMVRHFGPVRSTMITALVPGLSALGAVALLGEPMHWNLLAGLALVTGGILLGVLVKPAATGAAR